MMRWDSLGVHARNVARPFPYRPRLEVLEGRELPSTVTNLNDAGAGSLRQAILDTPAGGTVDFQPGLSGTIPLATGELLINQDLTIAGPGANVITVSGNQASRVFEIAATFTVDISGLTIADGRETYGGGILNEGTLTVSNSTLSGNSALYSGGGIDNSGLSTITITSSTLSGNSANSRGGGIDSGGTLTITNSTLSGNSAFYSGGGIDIVGGPVTITNSTLSGNSATLVGGINIFPQASTALRNTILTGNTTRSFYPDLEGALHSQGHNLIGNGNGGSGFDPTDLVGTASNPIDPLLGPLQDNGGPTLTRALLPGSPAIDAGDNTGAPVWDQRGAPFHRIVNATIDIGAFEVQARGHRGPTHQPLPDPVPVQVLGTPAGPLVEQPPTLPADSSPLPGTGARGADQPGTDPVATVGAQLPLGAFITADAGNGQPVESLGPMDAISFDLPAFGTSW